ncbi:MAG: hypothetical protein INR73_27010 [Williamsia sp.]|nr:hypothetical protein [Williamsia sp.]
MNRLFLLALILAGCSNGDNGKIRQSVPGVYIRHFEAAYSRGDDTLFISRMNGTNSYRVIRKSTFRRIKNKRWGEPEQKVESWVVLYDFENKNLYEQKRERRLTPLPDSNKLWVGTSSYSKIE